MASIPLLPAADDFSEDREIKSEHTQEHSHGRPNYAGVVDSSKHHLSVCLQLLGIMYRHDEEHASEVSDDSSAPKVGELSTWPLSTRGDDLYLAMVMLNSALLKALHVADSFQMHCHREFPSMVFAQHDEVGPAISEVVSESKIPSEEECVSSEEYRRLQAECLVLCETSRSLEQQQSCDEQRISQLEEECKQMRFAVTKQQESTYTPASGLGLSDSQERDTEVVELQSLGVTASRSVEGGAVISDSELQRLVLIVQDLNRIVREARAEASEAAQRAEEAMKSLVEAAQERKELEALFGTDHDGLCGAVLQLSADVGTDQKGTSAHANFLKHHMCSNTDPLWGHIKKSHKEEAIDESYGHTQMWEPAVIDATKVLGGTVPSVSVGRGREATHRAVFSEDHAAARNDISTVSRTTFQRNQRRNVPEHISRTLNAPKLQREQFDTTKPGLTNRADLHAVGGSLESSGLIWQSQGTSTPLSYDPSKPVTTRPPLRSQKGEYLQHLGNPQLVGVPSVEDGHTSKLGQAQLDLITGASSVPTLGSVAWHFPTGPTPTRAQSQISSVQTVAPPCVEMHPQHLVLQNANTRGRTWPARTTWPTPEPRLEMSGTTMSQGRVPSPRPIVGTSSAVGISMIPPTCGHKSPFPAQSDQGWVPAS